MNKYNNLEAEKILVNQMILDGSIIPNVYDVIKPDTFYSASYRLCYESLLSLARKCAPIDEIAFRTECAEKVGYDVIDAVTDAASTSSNWEYYANEIKACYTARTLRGVLQNGLEKLTDVNGPEIANSILAEVGLISANTTSCEVHDINKLTQRFISKLDEAITNHREYTGYPTGLKNIDDITLGLQPEFIVIGARPSLGKTALGEQMALYTSGVLGDTEGVKTMFIELEMSAEQLTERAVANLTHIGMNKIRTGMLSTAQLNKIVMRTEALAKNQNFLPVTCNTRKISDVIACIRREVRLNNVKIAFIDHVGLIHPEGKYNSAWEGVKEISHSLQQLQRELKIPIVVLSQVGRDTEGKKPTVADLRGSGALEEDADTIMLIDRDRQEDTDEQRIPAVINIAKNRNGGCGKAKLYFLSQEVMFVDNNDDDKELDMGVFIKKK